MIQLAKQMDAQDFLKDVPDGYDTIVFDPPYMDEKKFDTYPFGRWNGAKKDRHRYIIDQKELAEIKTLLLKKLLRRSCAIIECKNDRDIKYFEKILPTNATQKYSINWYKGFAYGGLGGFIRRNTEYIDIYLIGRKPDINYSLKETEEYPPPNKALAKPYPLIKNIFQFVQAKYVVDPFAGSFVTAKVCRNMRISYATCDKYEKVPKFNKINLLGEFIDRDEKNGK